MEKTIFITGGGKLDYSTPKVDLLDIAVEKGFAVSDNTLDYSEGGDSGFGGNSDNEFGTLD